MTGPAYMNYEALVENIKTYSERPNDTKLAAQIPQIVLLAETEVATDLKVLGTELVVNGVMDQGQPTLAKPEFWRSTVSIIVDLPSGKRVLKKRTPEFLQTFSPEVTALGEPRFYADLNATRFVFAPTPAADYQFQMIYNARIPPLSPDNQTNWFTTNAPQVLLYSCMYHTQLFLKNFALADNWRASYAAALGALTLEDMKRVSDRSNKEE